jgi:hypothetical protein
VGLGPAHASRKVGAKVIGCTAVGAIKPGGASLDANIVPAPTEGTASVKLIGVAKKATAVEPEALEPRAEGKAQHGLTCRCCHRKRTLVSPGHHHERPRQRAHASAGLRHRCRCYKKARPRVNAGQSRRRERHRKRAWWLCKRARQPS